MEKKDSILVMTCEYLQSPLGIQNEHPRFAWRVEGSLACTMQKSYRIAVKDESGDLIWDSGLKMSGKNSGILYEGPALESRKRYLWDLEVSVHTDGGEKTLSSSDSFETGILCQKEWTGEWIRPCEERRGEAPLIRRTFTLEELPQKARLYVCGLGYCETTINGRKVGDSSLDPGWTDYNKTALYRVYDVGSYLKTGENVLGFELGEGWQGLEHEFFRIAAGTWPSWNSRPKVLCNLYLDEKVIATKADGNWRAAFGPVTENNIYDGETYDASREKTGWNEPGYSPDETWKEAVGADAPKGVLRSQIMPPIGERLRRTPVHVAYTGENDSYNMTVDYGQNMAGWVEIEVEGRPGASVIIRYAETLNPDGTVNQKNLRGAKARDEYIIGQEGRHTWHPRFTYHGFRYVSVEMEPGTLIYRADAVQISTGNQRAASFSCSDELVNRIYETVMRTEENNIHSVPTDCPQRDERLGWVNDMTARYENAIYNFDCVLAYEKWMQDLMDSQAEDGAIPDTAPYYFGGRPGSHITSVFVLLPWCLYSFTNDRQILERYYEPMKKYVRFKLKERTEKGLLPDCYFGEWAPPMTEAVWGWGENAVPRDIPQPLVTTSYLYYDCAVMSRMGRELGMEADADFFDESCGELQKAINEEYYREEGFYGTGAQGADVMPLFLGIVPEGEKNRVMRHLLTDIVKKRGNHLATGNQMTKLIYDLFVQEGMADLALTLMTQTTYPSIGYMLEQGATTIWERWENLTVNHMNSHDHPMLGAFAVWLLKGLAGIKPVPGEVQRYEIRPLVPKKLEEVTASRQLPGGRLGISWKKAEEELQVSLRIPWNTSVRFYIPEGYRADIEDAAVLESGNYEFRLWKA